MNRGEIGDAIWGDVLVRVTHFIDQLFFDHSGRNATTRPGVFGNHKRPIRRSFNDWKTNIFQIGNRLPIHQAVSARCLSPAFNRVPGNSSGSQLVPIISRPAKFVSQWRQRQPGICTPTGDNNLGILLESFQNWLRPKIHIGALHLRTNRGKRLARIHIL